MGVPCRDIGDVVELEAAVNILSQVVAAVRATPVECDQIREALRVLSVAAQESHGEKEADNG